MTSAAQKRLLRKLETVEAIDHCYIVFINSFVDSAIREQRRRDRARRARQRKAGASTTVDKKAARRG